MKNGPSPDEPVIAGPAVFLKSYRDFTLLSASGLQQAESSGDDTILVPLRGMKIQFPYSRHFMISRTHPLGDPVFRALEEGLQILHDRGVVTRAMTECGFISEDP